MPALTESIRAVLDRAFDPTATFTASEIGLIEPIAAGAPPVQPLDERTLRQSIGTLSAAMPAQATDEAGGKLKLGAYLTMLAGYDHRALAYACRRCLAELDWFPTVHQLIERINVWVSPERAAIAAARSILRSGRRLPDGDSAGVTVEEMRGLRERAEAAATSLCRPRVEAVAFSDPAPLQAHQMRIPNKGDYERLFGVDPETQRAKAEAMRLAEEEADRTCSRTPITFTSNSTDKPHD